MGYMMVTKITIYGWILPNDPVMGQGSGTLVDLTYFVNDNNIRYEDILTIIERQANKKMIRNKYEDYGDVVDRVVIENWDPYIKNITIGAEQTEQIYPQGRYM